jgi:hypothetical protein
MARGNELVADSLRSGPPPGSRDESAGTNPTGNAAERFPLREEDEADRAMLWQRAAFRRRQLALLTLTAEVTSKVAGHPSGEVIAEFAAAEADWRASQFEVARIVQELRASRR